MHHQQSDTRPRRWPAIGRCSPPGAGSGHERGPVEWDERRPLVPAGPAPGDGQLRRPSPLELARSGHAGVRHRCRRLRRPTDGCSRPGPRGRGGDRDDPPPPALRPPAQHQRRRPRGRRVGGDRLAGPARSRERVGGDPPGSRPRRDDARVPASIGDASRPRHRTARERGSRRPTDRHLVLLHGARRHRIGPRSDRRPVVGVRRRRRCPEPTRRRECTAPQAGRRAHLRRRPARVR